MSVKRAWIVCGQDGCILGDKNGDPQEFKSEQAAIARAGEWVNASEDVEAWVYALTLIVERPTGKPVVTRVK